VPRGQRDGSLRLYSGIYRQDIHIYIYIYILKLNSVARVRERTIPTERSPLVGEVSANFLRIERCHVVNAADPYGRTSRFSRPEPLLFLSSSSSLVLTRAEWTLLLLRKSGRAGK
jgi:hypothetical protein